MPSHNKEAAPAIDKDPEGPETSALPDDHEPGAPITIVDWVDSDFEALKQAARASKTSKKKPHKLNEAIEEAVAHLSENQDESADDVCDEAPRQQQ